MTDFNYRNLPGENVIRQGLSDLSHGMVSISSLLVSIGAPRLEKVGIHVSNPLPSPEMKLYQILRSDNPDAAHSQYNAWIRRLVSFERAAECVK